MLLVSVSLASLAGMAQRSRRRTNIPKPADQGLVPYAPGGATDITARIVGDDIQKITGQPSLVINKPGAFGLLAIDEMVKSAPDGYTLMIGNVSTNAITPIIFAEEAQRRLREERGGGDQPDRRAGVPGGDDGERFPAEDGGRVDRLRQEKPRQAPLRHASASAPIRITTWPISPSAPAIST